MTSDSEDTTDDRNRKAALNRWAEQVRDAHLALFPYLATLGVGDDPLGLRERGVIELVAWLASLHENGHDLHPDEVQAIDRIEATFRPAMKGEKIVRAVKLVREFAELYRQAPAERSATYLGNTRTEIAHLLTVHLGASVHPGFADLDKRLKQVEELLALYEPSKGRRTKDGKYEGMLAASGVVAGLNTLAKCPLGALDSHAVDSAVDRLSKNTSHGA